MDFLQMNPTMRICKKSSLCHLTNGDGSAMAQANTRNTTYGKTEVTQPIIAGAESLPPRLRAFQEAAGATAPTIQRQEKPRKMGTPSDRLSILLSELLNCKKSGMDIRWGISKKPPHRILVAVYQATICQKCGTFLLMDETGQVICKNPACEWFDVQYEPDQMQETDGG